MTKYNTIVWKEVSGYEDFYQVNNVGEVRSLDRTTTFSNGRVKSFKGQNLSLSVAGAGYLMAQLSYNGEKKKQYVHRLVAKAFIKNDSNKPEINHKDGNKLNNSVENLEWCTSSENKKHAYKNGLRSVVDVNGEKNGRSKLKEKEIIEIREKHKQGFSYESIGKVYGVHKATIGKIVRRKLWSKI